MWKKTQSYQKCQIGKLTGIEINKFNHNLDNRAILLHLKSKKICLINLKCHTGIPIIVLQVVEAISKFRIPIFQLFTRLQKRTQGWEAREDKLHPKVTCSQFNQHMKAKKKLIRYHFSIVTDDYYPTNMEKMGFPKLMQVEIQLLFQDTSLLQLYNLHRVQGTEYFNIEKWWWKRRSRWWERMRTRSMGRWMRKGFETTNTIDAS